MSHRKKGASHYDKAVTRLAALRSIDEKIDLGNGITITTYEDAIKDLRDRVDDYNTMLSILDEKRIRMLASEKLLRDWSDRMLTGVASRFGKNFNEYVMAGGTKKSEIKHSSNKKRRLYDDTFTLTGKTSSEVFFYYTIIASTMPRGEDLAWVTL